MHLPQGVFCSLPSVSVEILKRCYGRIECDHNALFSEKFLQCILHEKLVEFEERCKSSIPFHNFGIWL